MIGVGGGVLPSTVYVRNRPRTHPAAQHQRGYCFSVRGAPRPMDPTLPPVRFPCSQPGPCLSLRMSVSLSRSDWGRRGHPFREKVQFSLNSTHFHENGGISPFWGFFAKRATWRAKAPFGAPSREVACSQWNIDGFGSHFPPKALLELKSSNLTRNHPFS